MQAFNEAINIPSEIRPVCPLCRGHLSWAPAGISCSQCTCVFPYQDGFADLIVGGRFDDEEDAERAAYETASNEHLTRNYLIPTFTRYFRGTKRPKVLSLGCGLGIDVEMLVDSGFDIIGIDCGNRAKEWPKRRHNERLYLANGKALPFENGVFDLVYCGCVFPHVGVVGDSNRVLPDHFEQRLQIAREMTRVLKPGGRVMVSSPNRQFPFDLFHGRSPAQPRPRFNPPGSRFLLSSGDYRNMFRQAGCAQFELLPVNGYWGFHRRNTSIKGKLTAWPVKTLFELVSQPAFSFLRGSVVNPWLVMMMNKAA
jgi:SAM-dependent methyltransferase